MSHDRGVDDLLGQLVVDGMARLAVLVVTGLTAVYWLVKSQIRRRA